MANLKVIQRLIMVVRGISRHPHIKSDELLSYVNRELEIRYGAGFGITLRTLQRDFRDISELFGFDIKCDDGYYIEKPCDEQAYIDRFDTILLNFEILDFLGGDSQMMDYCIPEHHRVVDSEKMYIALRAIKEQCSISFDYTYYRYENSVRGKVCKPYFLKESNNRWYLLALDGEILKNFAVDRMNNIKIMNESHFERKDIDVNSLFKDSFGIWMDEDDPVERVVLSYDSLDASFIKSLPLHNSQEILIDNEKEFRVELNIKITNDFVMELLSRSRSLEVIEPIHLRKKLAEIYKNALERNKI